MPEKKILLRSRLWLVLALVLLNHSATAAPAPIRCAVLADATLANSPLPELVTAGLAEIPAVRMVDRAAIERVLQEQRVTALLSPDAGPQRAAAGRLMQADVLVFLTRELLSPPAAAASTRPQPDNPAEGGVIRVIVCETHGGLRLSIRAVPWTGNPETDAAATAAVARVGVEKSRQRAEQVVAVPPFTSGDLGYEADSLKAAYPRLIEQLLLDQPGVVVVELAEADAIARELAIAGAPDVARPLPVYVLGEYRTHVGAAGKLAATGSTMSVQLTLRQGTRILSTFENKEAKAEAVPAWLRGTINDWVRGKADAAPPQPATEAKLLAERASAASRVGYWDEALALAEASLLLVNNAEPHQVAWTALSWQARRILEVPHDPPAEEDRALGSQALHLYIRSLPHFEHLLRAGKAVQEVNFSVRISFRLRQAAGDREVERLRLDALRLRRECGLAVVRWATAKGEVQIIRRGLDLVEFRIGDETVAQAFALKLDVLKLLPDHPHARFPAMNICGGGDALARADPAGFIAFLAAAESLPQQCVKEAVRYVRQQRTSAVAGGLQFRASQAIKAVRAVVPLGDGGSSIARKNVNPPSRTGEAASPHAVKVAEIVPLRLAFEDETGAPLREPPGDIAGYFPAGAGIDVAYTKEAIFRMSEKGRLRRIAIAPAGNRFHSLCYDGRYVWAPTYGPTPLVLLIDPISARTWSISHKDGLPPMTGKGSTLTIGPFSEAEPGVVAAAIEPGWACVSAYFGRSWIAMIRFDPRGHAAAAPLVKVLHEAKDVPDQTDAQAWRNISNAFRPLCMAVLTAPRAATQVKEAATPPARCIIICRKSFWGASGNNHPLVVDPDTLKVTVLAENVSTSEASHFTTFNGAMFWLDYPLYAESASLRRLRLPDLQVETLRTGATFGPILFGGGGVHVVSNSGWFFATATPEDGAFQKTTVSPPVSVNHHSHRSFASSHYDAILVTLPSFGSTQAVSEVRLKEDHQPGSRSDVKLRDGSFINLCSASRILPPNGRP